MYVKTLCKTVTYRSKIIWFYCRIIIKGLKIEVYPIWTFKFTAKKFGMGIVYQLQN